MYALKLVLEINGKFDEQKIGKMAKKQKKKMEIQKSKRYVPQIML